MRTAHAVPSTRDVVPGARVNIVLKADQRTGRTVSGSVFEVLTRGDHPRGIKVRLADGRVGRVQSMGDGPVVATAVQEPAAEVMPLQEVGLADYVVTRSRRRNGNSRTRQTTEEGETVPPAACPVCGDFEGDEAAVAHHVAKHFDE